MHRLVLLVLFGLALGCQEDEGGTTLIGSDSGPDVGADFGLVGTDSGPIALVSDYEGLVDQFCRQQFPPAAEAGQTGANCVNGSQCDSGTCIDGLLIDDYCSLECPLGTECPRNFSCRESRSGDPICFQDDQCYFGGLDLPNCVTTIEDEIQVALVSCQDPLDRWFNCIVEAGRICTEDQANAACGLERGRLEACCWGCERY